MSGRVIVNYILHDNKVETDIHNSVGNQTLRADVDLSNLVISIDSAIVKVYAPGIWKTFELERDI